MCMAHVCQRDCRCKDRLNLCLEKVLIYRREYLYVYIYVYEGVIELLNAHEFLMCSCGEENRVRNNRNVFL